MKRSIYKLYIGFILLAGLIISACSSDEQNGDTEYLAGDMMIVEVDGVTMYFLDNHDGTVSVTYDQRNPMHKTIDNKYTLTEYKGELVVPASITFKGSTYVVTGVTEGAFMNNTQLTKVTLPVGIRKIGKMAWFGCTALEEINIPEGMMDIPDYCFQNCRALRIIQMPQHLNSIGDDAFKSCTKLETLTIPEGITELRDGLFNGFSSLTSLSLPTSLRNVGKKTFMGCSKLVELNIPTGMTELADSAFANCTGLLMVTLPATVQTLGVGTFAGCHSLIEVTIPKSVTEIKPGCFCSYNANGEANWKRLTLNMVSEIPPKVTGTIANQTERRRIVVPRGYRDVYLETPYWNEFLQVMERNY